jgi:hypothetical protein
VWCRERDSDRDLVSTMVLAIVDEAGSDYDSGVIGVRGAPTEPWPPTCHRASRPD